MFERFTDRARQVVMLAQEEARAVQHNYIGTEHLLLGLLREGTGIGGQALLSLGLDLEQARAELERRIGRGPDAPMGHIPFTPRAKKVLELSLREAMRLGHSYIGTEHILLGLVREGEGVAAQILMTTIEGGLSKVQETLSTLLVPGSVAQGIEDVARRAPGRLGRFLSTTIAGPQDEVRKRLEAIEARLSVIERLLRDQRGEEEVS